MASSCLNADVKSFETLQIDRDRNSSYFGSKFLGGQIGLLSVSIRPVNAVEKRRRYAVGEIPKARAK